MTLFEWFFERNSPGPVGHIQRSEDQDDWSNGMIIVCGVFAIIALGTFIWYATLENAFDTKINVHGLRAALLALYLFVAASYTVYPDTNNMGFLGGMINNPFRYTDNINRFLVFILIFLIPGKLVMIPLLKLSKLLLRLYYERTSISKFN